MECIFNLECKLYLGGNLHDIKISESDIMSIINTQKDTLELLAEEHLKKSSECPKTDMDCIVIGVFFLKRKIDEKE